MLRQPTIEIFGSFDRQQLFCAGSVTKMLTTFVVLSLLSEKHQLSDILDDENFLDTLCANHPEALNFLQLFQKKIGSRFSIRDVCSFHTGLPYSFNPTTAELENVKNGNPFKHHSVMDEKLFLELCEHNSDTLYPNRSKFHYSEVSIMLLAYLIEKVYQCKMEDLFQTYVVKKFDLAKSLFSRVRPENVFIQDLSEKFDYAATAILDHGYYSYGSGFYTTLDDLKKLLEAMIDDSVFRYMVDVKSARCASDILMNGLTIELRQAEHAELKQTALIYGYDGMSFSGCTTWAYSELTRTGYVTFGDDADAAYQFIYKQLGCTDFNPVPAHTQKYYSEFVTNYSNTAPAKEIPANFQGSYQRVRVNDTELTDVFVLGNNYLTIRDPDLLTYDLVYASDDSYHIKADDGIPDSRISLYATGGQCTFFYNGSLYKRVNEPLLSSPKETARP